MRKLFLIFLSAITITALLNSCRKSDNPKLPDLTRVPTPALTLDAASDKFINPVSPATFKGKFVVDLLFADEAPQKYDVVVMKNGNPNDVKVIKADVTTFPTTIDVTGQQLIDLFGTTLKGGDKFDFGVNITNKQGQLILAFPLGGGTPYGAGVVTAMANVKPGAATSLQFLMPCPFVASAYAGDFIVTKDEWNDYKVGAVIPVKVVNATQLSFEYAVDPGTAKPILLTINPADNSITVTKQVYGNYGSDIISAESVAGPLSAVNPCDLTLSVRLKHTEGSTSFGSFTIQLKKK